MKGYKSLLHIANGFYTANKINEMRNPKNREAAGTIKFENVSNLINVIKTISENAPEKHKTALNHTVELSNQYLDTYRSLKEHFNTNIKKTVNKEDIIKTLQILKPALSIQKTVTVEKILRLYEALNGLSQK